MAELAILIEAVCRIVYYLILYGLLLAIFASICLFFVGYFVYAWACWRNRS